jgi:HK97 family phage prohead protease
MKTHRNKLLSPYTDFRTGKESKGSKVRVTNEAGRLEKRSMQVGAELRTAANSRTVAGTAIVYRSPSLPLPFIETIAAGAFSASVSGAQDIRFLVNHDSTLLLARTSSKTLNITEDSKGVHFRTTLGNSSAANDLLDSIQRGDVTSCSFGFQCVKDAWTETRGQVQRTILKANLFEVSATGDPAYQASTINVRSMPAQFRSMLAATDDDLEDDTCACDCENCLAGDCDACSDPDCDDEDCSDCPAQSSDEGSEGRSILIPTDEDWQRLARLQLAQRR